MCCQCSTTAPVPSMSGGEGLAAWRDGIGWGSMPRAAAAAAGMRAYFGHREQPFRGIVSGAKRRELVDLSVC